MYWKIFKLKHRLIEAVQARMGSGVNVHFRITDEVGPTAAAKAADQAKKKLRQAHEIIDNNQEIKELVDMFGGEVVADSIQPVRNETDKD